MTSKQILILVFSLFAFCLGNPDCSPAARCKDLWIAKECDVVKECIEEWSTAKPVILKDDVCSICLEMVKEARDTLRSNTTMEELKEVFEGSCSLLTLKPAVRVCDRLVDQFVPELVDILSSEMDPQTVCTVSKLCNNAALRTSQKESLDCTECQAFVRTSEIHMRSLVSPEDFKYGILRVCRSAGSYSDACSHLGLIHASYIYDLVKSILYKEPCEATLMCPIPASTEISRDASPPADIRKAALCSSCNRVMSNLRKRLLRAKSAEGFAENIIRICKELDLSNSTCAKMISPEFFEKLSTSETLPKLFCQATFCNEKSEDEEIPVWPLVSISDKRLDTDFFDFLTFSDSLLREKGQIETQPTPRPTISYGDEIANPVFLGPVLTPSKLYAKDEEECNTCNSVLEALSESVRHLYLKNFEAVCAGVKNSESCERFLNKYSTLLSRAYAEGGVSKEWCADLVPSCQVKRSELTPPQSCSLCLSMMNVFKNGNSTLLRPFLQEKCSRTLGTPEYICKDLTSTFGSLASLLQTSTERETCSFVKLCESSPVEAQPLSKPSCETCTLTIQSLADVLKSNTSDGVIESVLDSLCELLPHVEKRFCFNVVKTVGVEGFKKLIENINPTEICQELHICKPPESETTTTVVPDFYTSTRGTVTHAPANNKVPCKVCMMAVKMLLDQLQDDKTEDAIRKALDNICHYFPEETRDTCQNLIDQYAEDLIDMIIADFNATEICTFLKLCPTQHLFGGDGHDKNVAIFDVNTNEVRDWIDYESQDAYHKENETSAVAKVTEEAFQGFHKIVQQCAMCEALVGVITTHKSMLVKGYDFSTNAYKICGIVPKDKIKMCTEMIVSYGPSMVNLLLDHKVDPNEVCVYLTLCDEQMQAKVNQPVSVPEPKVVPEEKNDCMLGPVFWCANAENAEKCGTFLHCQETVWKSWKSPPKRRSDNL